MKSLSDIAWRGSLAALKKRVERDGGETLTVEALSEALGMIRDGRISDSKTICTLLFAASFEPELDGRPGDRPEDA